MIPRNILKCRLRTWSCMGEKMTDTALDLSIGLFDLEVPASGLIRLDRV